MIEDENLSLESFKKLKELEEKLNEKTKNRDKKKKDEKNSVKNFMQLKSLEYSLPLKFKKKIKSMKINKLKDLKKLAVTKKKRFFIKILDNKDIKGKKKQK
ncbi:hypothetical protein MKS88_003111 [Plasmodium brasilianum]|uniref:Uncharacterized protein n=2 Tax=Plasmodium (Plasmodium) TaxID=418103 RepID=A0A1A8WMV3_PLAMA|nr:conserved Plasmodium protein, unknown function [Plasmodium malariae]KAI4837697.1 hypothetical protein MKS88_003111 [Plasmodium brasilianum]SBS93176.1 conserved Plasmodium protein, unknown function [Plasmodium malariae]SCN44619.1 conserved Plasmodium protein, unknown function [Plasmodium malariae]